MGGRQQIIAKRPRSVSRVFSESANDELDVGTAWVSHRRYEINETVGSGRSDRQSIWAVDRDPVDEDHP